MRIGEMDVAVVSGGTFRLDGGGMFGVLPRPVWSRYSPPDERGRVTLQTNCLLIRTGDEVVLVDAGNGGKFSAKERDQLALQPGEPLLENLDALGVRPEDVTMVLLTHLHMDHCGGASRLPQEADGGTAVPIASFPRARYLVQRLEWEDAVANRSHMRVSYRPENLAPLEQSGRLQLLDGDGEVLPGIRVEVTPGHTRALQTVFLESGGQTLAYPADVVPTVHHLRPFWGMAYDLLPYEALLSKQAFLARAAREGWLLVLDHEPERSVLRIEQREGEYAIASTE